MHVMTSLACCAQWLSCKLEQLAAEQEAVFGILPLGGHTTDQHPNQTGLHMLGTAQ